MIATVTLREALDVRGIDYGRVGAYGTQWTDDDGVFWTAHEDADGRLWFKSGPMDATEAAEVVARESRRK